MVLAFDERTALFLVPLQGTVASWLIVYPNKACVPPRSLWRARDCVNLGGGIGLRPRFLKSPRPNFSEPRSAQDGTQRNAGTTGVASGRFQLSLQAQQSHLSEECARVCLGSCS